MQIKSSDEMFGLPVMKLREFFRKYTNDWDVENVMYFFDFDREKADTLMIKLEGEGYIEKGNKFRDKQQWVNSIKGNALAVASAAKPILRTTAEKKVNEFLVRVKEVNKNEYYLYKIKKDILFGSYLGEAEQLGDIDLAVEIVPKENDGGKFQKLAQERSKKAKHNGRQFNNIVEEVYWPQTEALKYLKSRSRSISIHLADDPVLKISKHKVIFEEK
jgi:hypothetical protein